MGSLCPSAAHEKKPHKVVEVPTQCPSFVVQLRTYCDFDCQTMYDHIFIIVHELHPYDFRIRIYDMGQDQAGH